MSAKSALPRSVFNWLFSRSGDYRFRYGSAYGSNSVDFRKNRKALQSGLTPDKFRALADMVPMVSVVDIGAGEGILALELASRGRRARAIDITPRRHKTGLDLIQRWIAEPVQNADSGHFEEPIQSTPWTDQAPSR